MTASDQAIAFARQQIGKPYVFGATGPNSYDCSGLIFSAYKYAGVNIGRTTYQQIFNGREVARADLLPGDLLFPDSGHVQLFVGQNRVIEAPHTGAFVRETNVFGFWRARRVAEPGLPDPNGTGVPVSNVGLGDDLLSKIPVLGQLNKIAEHVSNPAFIKRIGIGAAGIGVVLAAIVFINRDTVTGAATTAVKAVI